MRITHEMLAAFAALSGDFSPVHVNDSFAQEQGFPQRIAHGLLLASLTSGILGMELPGENGILHEAKYRFRNACYPGDEIVMEVKVKEFFESVQTLILQVLISRSDGLKLVTGEIQSGLKERPHRTAT